MGDGRYYSFWGNGQITASRHLNDESYTPDQEFQEIRSLRLIKTFGFYQTHALRTTKYLNMCLSDTGLTLQNISKMDKNGGFFKFKKVAYFWK